MPCKDFSSTLKKDETSKAHKPDDPDNEIILKLLEIDQSKKSSKCYSKNHGWDIHIPAKSITKYFYL